MTTPRRGCVEVAADYEEGKDDLTKGRAATRVVLVQIVLQCVPAPSDTHHHMSAEDLREKKRRRKEEENKASVGGRQNGKTHSCMNKTTGPQHTHTHTQHKSIDMQIPLSGDVWPALSVA